MTEPDRTPWREPPQPPLTTKQIIQRFALTALPNLVLFATVGWLMVQVRGFGVVLDHESPSGSTLLMSIARVLIFLTLFSASFGVPLIVGLFALLKPAFNERIGFGPAIVLCLLAWSLVVPAIWMPMTLPGDVVGWLVGVQT